MQRGRDLIVQSVLGVLGVVFGTLSGIALAFAAVIPALLGMLAFVLSPLRVVYERVTRRS